jgi:hypothetical protein
MSAGMNRVALVAGMLLLIVGGCGRNIEERGSNGVAAQNEFFATVYELCGKSFEGRGVFSATESDPMLQQRLVMHVTTCTANEIRIPFYVGENRSRTWILTRSAQGLLFKHDHRHEDGTPEQLTNYGGWARDAGTTLRQSFPADDDTAKMLPAAATNVWTLEITPGQRFVYDLTRHDKPRFRAEFDLTKPL